MNTNNQNKANPRIIGRYRAIHYIEEKLREGLTLQESLREASARSWPNEQGRFYAKKTLEQWWYRYKRDGYSALDEKGRADRGIFRSVDDTVGAWVIKQVCEYPQIKLKHQYRIWTKQGRKLPALRTLYRYLKAKGYDNKSLSQGRNQISGPTKAFETTHANKLWMVDFSPGPYLRSKQGGLRTHLCLIIDDHSRLIPYGCYYPKANTEAFHHCLKESLMRRGLPQTLYSDNGGPFINGHTHTVCEKMGIKLVHHKPRAAWSKGKCERVFRTIQGDFESILQLPGESVQNLCQLNEKFSQWIQNVYHQRLHSTTRQSPEHRYKASSCHIRALGMHEDISQLFYLHLERRVRKDGTVRLGNRYYEVDLSLRTLQVQLRYDPFCLNHIEVWYQGRLRGYAHEVNLHLNAERYNGRAGYES